MSGRPNKSVPKGTLFREMTSVIRSSSVTGRMTRHGLPKAMTPAGMSRVTTLPAPITVPSPIVTPCMTTQLPPIQTLSPMVTGSERMTPALRWSGSRACVTV